MNDIRGTILHLVQIVDDAGTRRVGLSGASGAIVLLAGEQTVYDLALKAIERGETLAAHVGSIATAEEVDAATVAARAGFLPPLDHPDPAHLLVTGTGLTHLGSADARDRMHAQEPQTLTDSMRMFRAGVEGGRPPQGEIGVVPEWFFKGTGEALTASDAPLAMPAFALDGGEEPEVAGLYLVGPDGTPFRVGYALANEFSDHVQEKQNYLLLAHSKLRRCSVGPELRTGPLPRHVQGTARIVRDGAVVWEKAFLTGEDNMSHTLANLEHHHFKYDIFRRPGAVHVHTFGTSTASFADGVSCRPGDRFEISADAFHLPLRNTLVRLANEGPVHIQSL